jgi:UDP-2,3-diacylglucosamine hydrolase
MLKDLEKDPRPVYFISDAHLGAPIGPPDREARLVRLLRWLPGHAAGLFILGDLFDFWFEYRHAIPKGTLAIARALSEVLESGVPIAYLGGNHDFWVGSFLREELGIEVFDGPITLPIQGRTIHLAHGDGLGPGDTGYKIMKRVLRHRLAIAGYRSLHPDIGIPLAHRFSAFSRGFTEPRAVLLPKILRDVAAPHLRGEVSAMIMGHVHYPAHYRGEGRDFLIIGDWIENFTYVRMEKGEFSLCRQEWHAGDAGRRRTHAADGAGPETETRIEPEPFPAGWR